MSFQPIIPLSGYTGWRFLQRTLDVQQTAFQESQPIARATDYFRENIGKIESAADLVKDRQLLSVALGAFGLDDDINSKFFIEKILSEGTLDPESLANRLSDSRYRNLSDAFGFGDFPFPLTTQPRFVNNIIDRFESRQFERAVGETDNDMRLAMNLSGGLADIAATTTSPNAQWFTLFGNPPLRQVVQTALGLPNEIASVDIDLQLQTFKDRAQSVFGTDKINDFSDPDIQEKMIRLFLIRSESANVSGFSGASIALTLLQA